MTSQPAVKRFAVAPNTPNTIVITEPQVLILVAGTVDPTNLWEEGAAPAKQTTRADGYSRPGERRGTASYWYKPKADLKDAHDINWYWEDNSHLREAIGKLQKRHPNLTIFPFHGWSGDNAPRNRAIAGEYLCDRLCGGGGQKAYYPGWRNRPVGVHLLGHSHGGNVINEFTRRAAQSADWPPRWTIRSVTYLSTPFFKRLHPVDTTRFHEACVILNVANPFDLTQRVIADFNLHQLNGALRLVDVAAITARIAQLNFKLDFRVPLDSRLVDRDPSVLGVDPTFMMPADRASRLYSDAIALLEGIQQVIVLAKDAIDKLERGVEFPVALQLADRICAGRPIMSSGLEHRTG